MYRSCVPITNATCVTVAGRTSGAATLGAEHGWLPASDDPELTGWSDLPVKSISDSKFAGGSGNRECGCRRRLADPPRWRCHITNVATYRADRRVGLLAALVRLCHSRGVARRMLAYGPCARHLRGIFSSLPHLRCAETIGQGRGGPRSRGLQLTRSALIPGAGAVAFEVCRCCCQPG